MKQLLRSLLATQLLTGLTTVTGAAHTQAPQTLTLHDCLQLALKQNPQILKAQQELRRTHGLIVEARAPALPQLTASGQYRRIDETNIDRFPGSPAVFKNQEQPWSAQIEVSQLIYSGGRVRAAWRAAKLTDQIAALDFQRIVAESILQVRTGFYKILLAQAQVAVREQSVTLLQQQLRDTQARFDVGAVPRFNVLRAEVELANAKPPLIRAQNNLRLAREALLKLLGLDSPPQQDFTPITFAGQLQYEHRSWNLPDALAQARARRPELQQAEKRLALARETIRAATAGYKPEASVFANWGWRNTLFSDQIDDKLDGWTIGGRLTWPLFDGLLTHGKISQARAQYEQAELDLQDTRRAIELEVRQAYSDYLQALQLIEAQKKTVEQAEESLRLAEARFRAGTGTQLDLLSAQTALTEARSNEIQALYDYNVAIATLERVTAATVAAAD